LRQNLNEKRRVRIVDLVKVVQGVGSTRAGAGFLGRLATGQQA